ncbi:MAG: sigma-70 family RNA polymerase sigma factor [Thermoanaerobaculia bacterium]
MPNPTDTFLEQLPLIEQIIRVVCRGRRMNAADTEEFAAFVKLRLIERDYAVIRQFKGRSSFGTFLTTVISRLLNDYSDREWGGRWRNSAEAKRMGEVAEDLERIVVRDMRSLDEAFAELAAKYPGTTRAALEAMAARFPTRHRPRISSLEDCEPAAVSSDGVEVGKAEMLSNLSSMISAYISRLPKEDQLIFQLRFEEDLPVPRIAQMLHLDMQSVYRRLRKHFRDLRQTLEDAGISKEDVDGLTGQDGALLDFHLKTDDGRPSNDDEDPDGAPEESA